MRFDADWMSRADDRILEHLAEEGPDTPKEMADSDRVRFSRQHITPAVKHSSPTVSSFIISETVSMISLRKGNSISPANSTLVTSRANEPTPLEVLPTGRRMGCCPSGGG